MSISNTRWTLDSQGSASFSPSSRPASRPPRLLDPPSVAAVARADLAQFAQATRLSLIAFGVAGLFHPVAYHFYFYYLAGLASALSTGRAARPYRRRG